jgi:dimethylargininase
VTIESMKTYAAPYVSHDAGALAGAVVLRPGTAVDRLVPLHGEPSPIADRALAQHAILVRTLRDRGVTVTELGAELATPTAALLADCAVLFADGALVTRPAQVERRHEAAVVEAALGTLGIPVAGRIEAPGLLDGSDVIVAGETVFVGVARGPQGQRQRSNALGRKQLEAFAARAGKTVVELPIAADVVHLRNVFSVVGTATAIAAPEKVDLVGLTGMTIVELPRGEEYAAGVLPLGEKRVLANLRFRESLAIMRKAKIAVEAIDLWEFGKAGAGVFSLVLAVKRN